jgi:hypothetical protein
MMLLSIAGVLLLIWLLGFVVFRMARGFIHVLLILCVLMVAVHFLRR